MPFTQAPRAFVLEPETGTFFDLTRSERKEILLSPSHVVTRKPIAIAQTRTLCMSGM